MREAVVRPVIPALESGRREDEECMPASYTAVGTVVTAAATSLKVTQEHKLHMRWADGQ